MQDNKWQGAGWLSVAVAGLMPLSFVLSIVADTVMKGRPREIPFTVMVVAASLCWTLCSIIVLYRFRELLNERYDFAEVNTPIQALLILLPVIALVSSVGRLMTSLPIGRDAGLGVALVFIIPMIAFSIAMGLLSVYIGVRLLAFEGNVRGLVKPYAILSIIGGACFALVLFIPFGALTAIASQVLLALIFFKAAEEESGVEFV